MQRRILIISGAFILLVGLITLVLFAFQRGGGVEADLTEDGYIEVTYPEGVSVTVPEDWNPVINQSVLSGLTTKYSTASNFDIDFSIRYEETGGLEVEEYLNENYYQYIIEEHGEQGYTYAAGSHYEPGGRVVEGIYVSARAVEFQEGVLIAECKIGGPFNVTLVNECGDILDSFSVE